VITHVHDCDIERLADPAAHEGPFRDTYLNQQVPGGPYNSSEIIVGWFIEGGKNPSFEKRGLVLYDLNAFIPAGATITAAVLHIYVDQTNASGSMEFSIKRCDPTTGNPEDWVETEATWNSYKSGSNWGTAGGDLTTPTVVLGAIATTGWKSYDILTMVSDAWDNRNGICTFFVIRTDDAMGISGGFMAFHTKNMYDYDAALPHHLRITYTLDGRTFQVMVQ
jgi:hypothetical protein